MPLRLARFNRCMADQQPTREEPCHPRHHQRRGSRIMDKIITSITCIPKRSRKKRKKHEAEQPLPPIPNNTRHEMHMLNASEARDQNEEDISDSCLSDMTMSPFSDLYSRTMSMTDSAESTSSRSLSSINRTRTAVFSPDNVRQRKASRAYTKTPETMSEATTESEGESEISSYHVSSPLPSTDLVQPKNGTLRQVGSVLAAVSLIASLARLMMYGETCALLLTSSIAFLVVMWCPMVKRLVPMWNKERYRMKTERRLVHAELQGRNYAGARLAYAKNNYKG